MRICSVSELMLDQLILDAFVGQRPRRVETERLEVARQHLHRRDAARLDRLDELARVANGKSSPPHSPRRWA